MKSPHFIALAAGVLACSTAAADTYTVRNVNDSGPDSFRQAILDANAHANVSGNRDNIAFAIPGAGVHTIAPLSPLPDITEPVIIDGFTQPTAAANTNPTGQGLNAALKIELNGNNLPFANSTGLKITGGGVSVLGLVINRFATHIWISGGNASRVQGCYIGTDPAGETAPVINEVNTAGRAGILVNTSSNLIGASSAASRNLISGATLADVELVSPIGKTAAGNSIQGNIIGLKASGSGKLGPVTGETASPRPAPPARRLAAQPRERGTSSPVIPPGRTALTAATAWRSSEIAMSSSATSSAPMSPERSRSATALALLFSETRARLEGWPRGRVT